MDEKIAEKNGNNKQFLTILYEQSLNFQKKNNILA